MARYGHCGEAGTTDYHTGNPLLVDMILYLPDAFDEGGEFLLLALQPGYFYLALTHYFTDRLRQEFHFYR